MNKFSSKKGGISPIFIGVGVVLLLIVLLRVSKTRQYQPEQQVAPPNSTRESTGEESQSQLKTYENKQEGLRLQYPGDWSVKENPAVGAVVAFGSPKESVTDTFVDNVNVSISDLSSQPDMTLNQVSDVWQKQTEAGLPQGAFKLSQIKPDTLAGEDAKRMVYTYSLQGKDIKGMVVITLKDKKTYIVTYSAEKASYDKFLNAANTIVTSLQVN